MRGLNLWSNQLHSTYNLSVVNHCNRVIKWCVLGEKNEDVSRKTEEVLKMRPFITRTMNFALELSLIHLFRPRFHAAKKNAENFHIHVLFVPGTPHINSWPFLPHLATFLCQRASKRPTRHFRTLADMEMSWSAKCSCTQGQLTHPGCLQSINFVAISWEF